MSRKNFISVVLEIQIILDNVKMRAKAMRNAYPDLDKTPAHKTMSFKYAAVGKSFIPPTVYSNAAISSINGKPRLGSEKNTVSLLFGVYMSN
jgi:hypothetical protein